MLLLSKKSLEKGEQRGFDYRYPIFPRKENPSLFASIGRTTRNGKPGTTV